MLSEICWLAFLPTSRISGSLVVHTSYRGLCHTGPEDPPPIHELPHRTAPTTIWGSASLATSNHDITGNASSTFGG